MVSRIFYASMLSCGVCNHLVLWDTDAVWSLSYIILVAISATSQCLTVFYMIWCCVWYMLSTFHLPANFRFAPLNAAPVLVSCYHLSTTNISSCGAELEGAWLQCCWAGWNPGSCCQWSVLPFNNKTSWWSCWWHCLRNPHVSKSTSNYHCPVHQYLRLLTAFLSTRPFGPTIVYTLLSKSGQHAIWSEVKNGTF